MGTPGTRHSASRRPRIPTETRVEQVYTFSQMLYLRSDISTSYFVTSICDPSSRLVQRLRSELVKAEEPSSKLDDHRLPKRIYSWRFSSSGACQNSRTYLQIGYGHLLPNASLLNIHDHLLSDSTITYVGLNRVVK
jgi:hypothetical protein